MNSLPRTGVLLLLTGLVLCGTSWGQSPATQQTFVEVQTRGPVHEAFAQPYDVAVQIDPVIKQKPPAPIPEEAPAAKPEGESVGWIPGYWAWDADNNEFLWISGVYRNAPPGRVYVAGYWEQTADGGWRWVHGFWAPADQRELPILPLPPAPLESGPSLPPPDDDSFYVPGCWSYGDTGYVWRPGCYLQCRPGLVWIPPCYVWRPSGCLYVRGYWDHPLERRGRLFAPAVFRRSPWLNPGWAWRPSHVITAAALLDALFVDGRAGHYRYGDWYGKTHLNRGIQPWHQVGTKNFDPLYAYYRKANRNNAGWQNSLATQYNDRLSGKAIRPPRSLGQQALAVNQTNNAKLHVAQPLTHIAASSAVKVTSTHTAKPLTVVNHNVTVQPQSKTVVAQPKMDHTSHVATVKTPPPQHTVHTPAPTPHVHAPPAASHSSSSGSHGGGHSSSSGHGKKGGK
jgi:hypothetical protein